MNYSKNLRRSAIAKRIVLSWIVVAIASELVGGMLGYALKTHIIAKQAAKEEKQAITQVQEETLVYGAYDDHTFTDEIPLNWNVSASDFKPLDCKMTDEVQQFVFYICEGYSLDFTLVMALIQHESDFDPDVISKTNDYGYMQINQVNHEWLTNTLGVTDYLDPYQNIRAGAFVLRKLFERYQNTNMVLMAYNMGETAASRLWANGIFETEYSQRILTIQQKFNEQLGD